MTTARVRRVITSKSSTFAPALMGDHAANIATDWPRKESKLDRDRGVEHQFPPRPFHMAIDHMPNILDPANGYGVLHRYGKSFVSSPCVTVKFHGRHIEGVPRTAFARFKRLNSFAAQDENRPADTGVQF